MSQQIVNNTGNFLHVVTDTSKIFLFGCQFQDFTFENSTYSDVTLLAGTLMGQVSVSAYAKALASGASDGSQFPVGILAGDYLLQAGTLTKVTLCTDGDVAEEKVILNGSDTMNTVISSRTIRARIGSDTVGIRLVPSTEMTIPDNS